MDYIIDFIDFLFNTITTLWDLLMGFISDLGMLVSYLGIVADICYSTISTMPDWLQTFGTITVLISVLYMVIGRQTGGSD